MTVKSKDQDFAIARRIYIKASHESDFSDSEIADSFVAYVTAESKTNLDKTMFQEAAATAQDVRASVPAAKYFLLVEWLDMTPISTTGTAIEEVLLLRQAKRLASNVRQPFGTYEGRQQNRDAYRQHLVDNPFSKSPFQRFIEHLEVLFDDSKIKESDVLDRGYF